MTNNPNWFFNPAFHVGKEELMIQPLCPGCGVRHSKDTACPDGTQWWAAMVECRICSHTHFAIVPVKPGDEQPHNIECRHCGSLTCDAKEED